MPRLRQWLNAWGVIRKCLTQKLKGIAQLCERCGFCNNTIHPPEFNESVHGLFPLFVCDADLSEDQVGNHCTTVWLPLRFAEAGKVKFSVSRLPERGGISLMRE
jgi:hypothetical protein